MGEFKERYAKYKSIPLDSVPDVIPIVGKEELEAIVGPAFQEFEHIGEGTTEDIIEFSRQNGTIDGRILMHHEGEEKDSYYGFIFSINTDYSELKENIPAGERRKIKLHCKNRREVAEKFREFIKLKEVKHYEKIVEKYARPDYAQNLSFYIMEDKDFEYEISKEQVEKNKYAICFDTVLKNKNGLHARPIGAILEIAKKYNRDVSIIKNGEESIKNSILSMLALAVENGQKCTVKIAGTDETSWKTAVEIYKMFENNFGED